MKRYMFGLFFIAVSILTQVFTAPPARAIPSAQFECKSINDTLGVEVSDRFKVIPGTRVDTPHLQSPTACIVHFSTDYSGGAGTVIDSFGLRVDDDKCRQFQGPNYSNSQTIESGTVTLMKVIPLSAGSHRIRACVRANEFGTIEIGPFCMTVECNTR